MKVTWEVPVLKPGLTVLVIGFVLASMFIGSTEPPAEPPTRAGVQPTTVEFITRLEGFRNSAYRDTKGHWTTGVGHRIKKGERSLLRAHLSDAEVLQLFLRDLTKCEAAISDAVWVVFTQNQFDAMASLCFNIGEDRFKGSEVVRRINLGDEAGAGRAFLGWVKPKALTRRRHLEAALFLTK